MAVQGITGAGRFASRRPLEVLVVFVLLHILIDSSESSVVNEVDSEVDFTRGSDSVDVRILHADGTTTGNSSGSQLGPIGYLQSLRTEQKRCSGQALRCPTSSAAPIEPKKAATHGVLYYLRSLRLEQTRCPGKKMRCPSKLLSAKRAKTPISLKTADSMAPEVLKVVQQELNYCSTEGQPPHSVLLTDVQAWKKVGGMLECPTSNKDGKFRAAEMYYEVRGCGTSGSTFIGQIDCVCETPCSCVIDGKQTAFTSKFGAIATTNNTKLAYVKTMTAGYQAYLKHRGALMPKIVIAHQKCLKPKRPQELADDKPKKLAQKHRHQTVKAGKRAEHAQKSDIHGHLGEAMSNLLTKSAGADGKRSVTITKRKFARDLKREEKKIVKAQVTAAKKTATRPVTSLKKVAKEVKQTLVKPSQAKCHHSVSHKHILRLCRKQCWSKIAFFKAVAGKGGFPTLATLCSQTLRGEEQGLKRGNKYKNSISRRRCHMPKPQRQSKKFTNHTYLPTPDGHIDAFDEGFAVPRFTELLERAYNKLPISTPSNPGLCQATLGLAEYGSHEQVMARVGDDTRVWDGKRFTWKKSSRVLALRINVGKSVHRAATCCIRRSGRKCVLEMSSLMIDGNAVFEAKVLQSKDGKVKATIHGCSWPKGGMPDHGHILRIQPCYVAEFPMCVLLKLTKAADVKRTSTIVQGFGSVLPFPGSMRYTDCKANEANNPPSKKDAMQVMPKCLAGFATQEAKARAAVIIQGTSTQRWTGEFFKKHPTFWADIRSALRCAGTLVQEGVVASTIISQYAPKCILRQQVLKTADSTIREAMAQLRFEVGMIALGDKEPAKLALPLKCPRREGCMDKLLPPDNFQVVCQTIDPAWCHSPDSSMIWPQSWSDEERRYDLHKLCPVTCKCTSCIEQTVVCPSKDEAIGEAKTVWYIDTLHSNFLAAIPPARVQELAYRRAIFSGKSGTKTKVSVIPRLVLNSGSTLEFKYRYLVSSGKGSKGPTFEISIGGAKVGSQQRPFTDHLTPRCQSAYDTMTGGNRCFSPVKTLTFKADSSLLGSFDIHFNNDGKHMLLQPVAIVTMGNVNVPRYDTDLSYPTWRELYRRSNKFMQQWHKLPDPKNFQQFLNRHQSSKRQTSRVQQHHNRVKMQRRNQFLDKLRRMSPAKRQGLLAKMRRKKVDRVRQHLIRRRVPLAKRKKILSNYEKRLKYHYNRLIIQVRRKKGKSNRR